jgi:hypothetical protein
MAAKRRESGYVPRNRYEGSPNSVVFGSTALLMRGLMHNIDTRLKKKKHLYDSLAEIPEYMKDRMRCNLPYYSKLFGLINSRATLLRELLNNLGGVGAGVRMLKDSIPSCMQAGAEAILPDVQFISDVCSNLITTDGNDSKQRTIYYNNMLTRIIELSHSIKKCCDTTYKELTDVVPYFMELGKDFILDYKQKNNTIPFMPASYLTYPTTINNVKKNMNDMSDEIVLLPSYKNGSDVYKYNYAARFLLANQNADLTLDHVPGAKVIYQTYAVNANKSSAISQAEYFNTLKTTFKLSRFLGDSIVYSRLFEGSIFKVSNGISKGTSSAFPLLAKHPAD